MLLVTMEMICDEVWKDIPNYENIYQVSNLGRIKSLRYWSNGGYIYKERILKPRLSKNGYLRITLRKNNNSKDFYIHRLVGECFLEKPNYKCEINHKDTIRTNNVYSNLEWCTHKENQNNPISIAKQIGKNNHMYGKNNYNENNSYKIICIETGICYKSIREASKITKIPYSSIQSHLTGRLLHAGGLHWKKYNKKEG